MKGQIIYSYAGNYKVKVGKEIYLAKPLGIFRNKKIKLIVGDFVELKLNNIELKEQINSITELYDRKNSFIRPLISNVENVLIVTSAVEPILNDFYLDKLISIFQINDINPILIFTKIDLLNKNIKEFDEIVKNIQVYKDLNYDVFEFGNEIDELNKSKLYKIINNKFNVITGQTGVGKSTFLNYLNPKLNLKTDAISKNLGRGKHTTRHSEAFEIFKNCFVVDTPGFSSLDFSEDITQLSKNFLNFEELSKKCKYNDCFHVNETDCYVKEHTDKRKYENYLKLYNEVLNKKKTYTKI